MRYGLLGAKEGFSRSDEKGQSIQRPKGYFGDEEKFVKRQKIWEHTKEMTKVEGDTN